MLLGDDLHSLRRTRANQDRILDVFLRKQLFFSPSHEQNPWTKMQSYPLWKSLVNQGGVWRRRTHIEQLNVSSLFLKCFFMLLGDGMPNLWQVGVDHEALLSFAFDNVSCSPLAQKCSHIRGQNRMYKSIHRCRYGDGQSGPIAWPIKPHAVIWSSQSKGWCHGQSVAHSFEKHVLFPSGKNYALAVKLPGFLNIDLFGMQSSSNERLAFVSK